MPTLSIIKADISGFVGSTAVHPDKIAEASRAIDRARGALLTDGQVATCGDDLASHS